MQKTNIITALNERLDKLEKWRAKNEKRDNKKADEEVCPQCGADLLFVEEGMVYCPKCEEYYETKEEKEK